MGLFDKQETQYPNNYPFTQEIINALWTSFWTPNEFSFRSDLTQFYNELTSEEQKVITRCVSMIAQVEIQVKRFWADIGKQFPHPSINDMGLVMGNNEVIHNQAYRKLLEVLQLQDEVDNCLKEPVVKGRVEYLKKHLEDVYQDKNKQYIYSIILFTLFVENTSLFGEFYTILNFNRYKSVLKDTAQQVQYTRQEEDLHSQAGILLINTLRAEYPHYFDEELNQRVRNECLKSLRHEGNILDWVFQGYESENLSSPIVKAYVKGRLSSAMVKAGFDRLNFTKEEKEYLDNNTVWMDEELLGQTLTDFFAKRPIEYQKHSQPISEEDLF